MTDLTALLAHSVELIRDNQAPSGAYVACPDFPTYRYSWFRDGAFIADAMSRAGDRDSADRFHGWCTRVIDAREGQVERLVSRAAAGETIPLTDHLHTRFTLEGHDSDEPWWNFQLDGYGTWLWALDTHLRRHGGSRRPHLGSVTAIVAYLGAFGDHACWDWWEEHPDQVHTSTLTAVAAGLRAVADWEELSPEVARSAATTADDLLRRIESEAVRDGHLTKWIGSSAVDASLISAFVPFRLLPVDGPLAEATVSRIERELAPAGVHRYLDDVYYGGGQWILLAGFLGSYHAVSGDVLRARELLDWMVAQADDDGCLPEQVNTRMLHPEHEQRWIDQWGPSASPLLWSHAMLLALADDLHLSAGEQPPSPQVETA